MLFKMPDLLSDPFGKYCRALIIGKCHDKEDFVCSSGIHFGQKYVQIRK